MTEPERRAAELRTLLGWLAHQRETIERIGERVERAQLRAIEGPDADVVAAIALYLQHYYTGIEDVLGRVAVSLDGSVPGGDDWHRLLLDQMRLDIPDARPALLTADLSRHLDVLRRFRHRVRHAYDQDYDWQRMAEPLAARTEAARRLPAFFARTETVIRQIIQALEQT